MAFTVFQRVVAGEPPTRARHPTERSIEKAFSGVYSVPVRGGSPPRTRGIQQNALERAFSGVYSLPEGGGRGAPHGGAASNRPL